MKINFTLNDTSMSGGIRAIFEIANGLYKRGHEVTITSIKGDHSWFPLEAEVIYVKQPKLPKILNHLFKLKNGTDLTYSQLELALQKYEIEPDLMKPLTESIPDCDINVATWFLTAFAVYRSGKGIPFFFFQDFLEMIQPLGQYYVKMFEESLYLPINIITGSNWLKNWINENYMKKAVVSGYGIDHSVFYPRSSILDNLEGTKIMGIFSRGSKYKGGTDLINALNIASKKIHDLNLILVCNNITFQNLIRDNDIKFKYTFFESPDDNKLAELYSSSDLFVFTSHIEGYGLPPLESMACGTPVVTTDCLGVRDFVIDENNALLVPPKNPEAIADAILKALKNSDLSNKLKTNGIKTAQKSTWDTTVDIFENAFLDSLNNQIEVGGKCIQKSLS